MHKIGIIVHKATKLELFLSKYLPYWIPFISNRKRIRIKWYYKYRYRCRVHKALVEALMSLPPAPKIIEPLEFEEFEWTVIN